MHARNFATNFQRYSLAILGCLAVDEPTYDPTALPSAAPQVEQVTDKSLGSTKTSASCPDNALFELELTATNGTNRMVWDLIMPNANRASETVISSSDASEYQENETHYYSACLQQNRYRFKMLKIGDDASYKLSIGGKEILNSESLNHPSNLFSFRFRVTANGYAPIASTRTRPKEI